MQAILKQFSDQVGRHFDRKWLNSPSSRVWWVRLANLVALILLASALARLTWMVVSPDTAPVQAGNAASSKPVNIEPAARLLSISNLHLFGKAEAPAVVDAPIVAPETRLQLKLKGVFASSDPRQAFAIIADSKNQDKAYRLGSSVSGGAVLHAVYPDRVILKRNGRLETLRMETIYKANQGNNTSFRKQPTRSATTKRVVRATPKLRQLKQTLVQDPKTIWQQVQIRPVLKNGSIRGYSVEHQDKQLMRSLTLRKGDVITAVNGVTLSDPSSLYGLMDQLSTKNSIELTIERNGQLQTIQLRL
ncbi:MAG: type II secretion system protein GspC [Thioalkalispiraceae bacterium]|jgi:general secretion pathway protein C